MRKCIRGLTILVFLAAVGIWSAIIYYQNTMPDRFMVTTGKKTELDGIVQVVEKRGTEAAKEAVKASPSGSGNSSLALFGIFPIKTVGIQEVEEPVVVVSGVPFGIKMYTDGVLIVGLSDVDTAFGPCNPARIAGLKVGDVVLSINGTQVFTNGEIKNLIEKSGGEYMIFEVRRDHLCFTVKFKAVKSQTENCYKSGFWVRDSSAGIGTLTFFDSETKVFAGLGHAVCDVDTKETLPVSTGEIVSAEISDIEKGTSGHVGSLDGTIGDYTMGILTMNSETGVFGTLTRWPQNEFLTMPIAMKQQVKTGPAKILTTISGTTPAYYDIEITQIRYNGTTPTKNMVIRVTDSVLLQKTGGIIQGVSGSPIIQNGRLVGAVTHVLVNDPTKGYGIFAENMLETAQKVSEQKTEKLAS